MAGLASLIGETYGSGTDRVVSHGDATMGRVGSPFSAARADDGLARQGRAGGGMLCDAAVGAHRDAAKPASRLHAVRSAPCHCKLVHTLEGVPLTKREARSSGVSAASDAPLA